MGISQTIVLNYSPSESSLHRSWPQELSNTWQKCTPPCILQQVPRYSETSTSTTISPVQKFSNKHNTWDDSFVNSWVLPKWNWGSGERATTSFKKQFLPIFQDGRPAHLIFRQRAKGPRNTLGRRIRRTSQFDSIICSRSSTHHSVIVLQGLWRARPLLSVDHIVKKFFNASGNSKFPGTNLLLTISTLSGKTTTKYSISRWYATNDSPAISITLHCLSDASSSAYGTVIYLRQIHEENSVAVYMVFCKTRAPPLKVFTIPRAELAAAYLMSKQLTYMAHLLDIFILNINTWTDSTIVLCRPRNVPSILKTFVAHRISAIQVLLPICTWRHVFTKDNPRGVSA